MIYLTGPLASTNSWLIDQLSHPETALRRWQDGDLVLCPRQTAGRGQAGNSWESEPGKNLTFSLLYYPKGLLASEFFRLSQAVCVGLCQCLEELFRQNGIPSEGLRIKWPNDLYWNDRKLAGILIENSLCGTAVQWSVAGIGLNVNQTEFRSDAPNPVSLRQILGHDTDLAELAERLQNRINTYSRSIYRSDEIFDKTIGADGALGKAIPPAGSSGECSQAEPLTQAYWQRLYRRDGYFPYQDDEGPFEARIVHVAANGLLTLERPDGCRRQYAFKQVRYLMDF